MNWLSVTTSIRRNAFLRRWTPLWFIVACYLYGLQLPFQWLEEKQSLSVRVDADTTLLIQSVLSHPSWREALDWWRQPWYSAVPYFRPLTMMAFWSQYHLLGERGLLGFQGLHWFYLGIALVLLWGFWSQIAGRGRAALGVGIFAAGANEWLYWPSGTDAFNCWKDSCDVWQLCLFVASSWAFLAFLRRGERRFWAMSLAFWLASVMTKESGYCLPFMLPVLLWHERKLGSRWRWVVPFWALSPLLWLYRGHVLSGWPNPAGRNGSWWHRALTDALGLPGLVVNGDWLALVPVFAFLVALFVWRGRYHSARWGLGLSVAGLTIAAIQAMRFNEVSFFDALLLLSISSAWPLVFLMAILSALWAQFIARRDRAQIFALLWVWVTFIPLAMQPPTSSHVHYPVAPGWSLFLACAFWALPDSLRTLAHWLQPLPREPRTSIV